MITRLLLAILVVLTSAGAASAQSSLVGTYEMEWAILHVPVSSDALDLTNGTVTIDIEPANNAVCPPSSVFSVQNAPASAVQGGSTTWCLLGDGSFDSSANTGNSGRVSRYTPDNFYVEATSRRGNDTIIAVGRRLESPPPPPPPGELKVFITQPRNGETVSGTVWVVMWVEGTSGSSNVFTLSVDGKVIRPETTSSRGPVTIPWFTVNNPDALNGTHTLTATVKDATGKTGTASISVLVKN